MAPLMAKLADLYVQMGQTQGAAGSVIYELRYTNTSTAPVTLRGYPGLSITDVKHEQIGDPAARSGQPYVTVTLQPGQTATSMFRTNNPDLMPCRPVPKYLRVFPPGSVSSVYIPWENKICGTFDCNPVEAPA